MRLRSSILATAIIGSATLLIPASSHATSRVLTDNQASKLTFAALTRTPSQWNAINRHSAIHNRYTPRVSYARNYHHGRYDHLRYSIHTVSYSYRVHKSHKKARHHYHT